MNNKQILQLEKARKHAEAKNGKCLSNEYINNKRQLIWKCEKPSHNSWSTTFFSIVTMNTWCRECYLENNKINYDGLKQAKKYAGLKNGFCLSTEYFGSNNLLEWKCSNTEHKSWFTRLNNIKKQDQWCPECSGQKNKTENRVRLFLETYFNFKLPSVRAVWNINPETGKPLELDGYNEENKIAFEHDGQHHFQHTLYSPSIPKKEFYTQQYRDIIKKENCKRKGVKLISIPILERNNRYQFFPLLKHVIKHCKEQDIVISYTYSQIKTMKKLFYIFDKNPNVKNWNSLVKIKKDKETLIKILKYSNNLNDILIYYKYKTDNKNRLLLQRLISELDNNHILAKKLYNIKRVNYPEISI